MTERLCLQTLGRAGSRNTVKFEYQRPSKAGVVHLGLGAFHRAHQALVFDELLQRGDARWGVLGVAMRSTAVADPLQEQDCLYSVQLSSAENTYFRVIGSVIRAKVAAREPELVIDAIADPCVRWITLTVTEKGYTAELAQLIVKGLALRQAHGLPGLTIASCDNLSGNGDKLKSLCLEASKPVGLQSWVHEHCRFPNSMVDRIVPAATAKARADAEAELQLRDDCALATEEFWEWIIEEDFVSPTDAVALAQVGVRVVATVKPFEEAKLRMLNGSHSALACIGPVLGLATVYDCISHPQIRRFVQSLMTQEIMPGLSRPNAEAYRDALIARFSNPALNHSVHQIATDFSQKIPQRWTPCIGAQLKSGGPIEHLAFVAAAWMRYCLGESENGVVYSLNDPQAGDLQELARSNHGDAGATVKAMLELKAIWGEQLRKNPTWVRRVEHWLSRINADGLLAAMAKLDGA